MSHIRTTYTHECTTHRYHTCIPHTHMHTIPHTYTHTAHIYHTHVPHKHTHTHNFCFPFPSIFKASKKKMRCWRTACPIGKKESGNNRHIFAYLAYFKTLVHPCEPMHTYTHKAGKPYFLKSTHFQAEWSRAIRLQGKCTEAKLLPTCLFNSRKLSERFPWHLILLASFLYYY